MEVSKKEYHTKGNEKKNGDVFYFFSDKDANLKEENEMYFSNKRYKIEKKPINNYIKFSMNVKQKLKI